MFTLYLFYGFMLYRKIIHLHEDRVYKEQRGPFGRLQSKDRNTMLLRHWKQTGDLFEHRWLAAARIWARHSRSRSCKHCRSCSLSSKGRSALATTYQDVLGPCGQTSLSNTGTWPYPGLLTLGLGPNSSFDQCLLNLKAPHLLQRPQANSTLWPFLHKFRILWKAPYKHIKQALWL